MCYSSILKNKAYESSLVLWTQAHLASFSRALGLEGEA
jgi:hypothetical protein